VLAHIAGHEHENYVNHYECTGPFPFGSGPSGAVGGFWHISTAAHIDWPQQARMVELIDNGNATMSLVLTILDHDGPPNPGAYSGCQRGTNSDIGCDARTDDSARGRSGEQVLKLASIGRELSYNDYQACSGAPGTCGRGSGGATSDRNVIIVLNRPWPLV
jgi:hypothetical protein